MTREEAIKELEEIAEMTIWNYRRLATTMAIEALSSADRPTGWIPIKWHEITEEEREREGYPKDWVVYLDCEMPSDEQKILVTTRWGAVEADVCYEDGEFSLDSGYDWIDDIIAWMPLPEPYKGGDSDG